MTRGKRVRRAALLAVVALALGTSGCGGGATSRSTSTGERPATTSVAVFFMRGDTLGVARRTVPHTTAVTAAALRELLAGPDAMERAAGLTTTVPSGTTLRRVAIADGVATVDLSSRYAEGGGSLSMFGRLGQVIYTLTQFPTVKAVRFELDGAPVTVFSSEGIELRGPQTRADAEGVTPAILVEHPAIGDQVSDSLRIAGTANVFEAVVSYEVRDADDRPIAQGTTMAACGTGCRGAFDVTVAHRPTGPRGTLVVFAVSPRDGSRIDAVRIPLRYQD